MNARTVFKLLILLSFILCTFSLNCPRCFTNLRRAACTSHFSIIGKVTDVNTDGQYVYYTLGFHKQIMARNGFSRAEKIIRARFPNSATDCQVPDTEFLRGHYYLFIGKVVSEGSRSLLEVSRCNYMDMEDIVKDDSALTTLKDLYSRRLCLNLSKIIQTGKMNNVFQKNNRL
ncbi:hypothetical protein ACF0H5_023767 [Mactra antiquata]